MADVRMDVFLLNTSQEGIERADLVANLSAAFKKDVETIEKMLRRPRTLIKADIDEGLAKKYKALIEKAGGVCDLVSLAQELSADQDQSVAQEPATPSAPLALEPIDKPSSNDQTEESSVQENSPQPQDGVCYCTKCGTVIRAGQSKCPKCFTPVTQFAQKSKVTAGFLALFLGGLGFHRFYLGQWWGVIYLLFWATFIPSIVSLFEAVVFWSTSQKTWDEKYGNVPKSNASIAIVLVVGLFLFISITGILAAVALPAYQDYTTRAKLASAMPLVTNAQNHVALFYKTNHALPTENVLANLPKIIRSDVVSSLSIEEGGDIQVTYNIPALHNQNTLIWTPNIVGSEIVWTCLGGSMPARIRPRECREAK